MPAPIVHVGAVVTCFHAGLAQPTGLLLLSLTGRRIAALTWFIGPDPLAAVGLPSDPSAPELVSQAL